MNNPRLNQLLEMYDENVSDSFIIFAIAKEYEKEDQLDKALEFYLDLKKKNKDYIGLYYHLAHLYEKLDDPDMALGIFNEGIKLATDQNDNHALSELKNAKLNLELEYGL